jgi:hypothetical protein
MRLMLFVYLLRTPPLATIILEAGSFQSVRELTEAIEEYLAAHNLAPKRYVWKAAGAAILAKIQRAREALNAVMNS